MAQSLLIQQGQWAWGLGLVLSPALLLLLARIQQVYGAL
jgi:hypothetical protein